jgi:hypothetical protein
MRNQRMPVAAATLMAWAGLAGAQTIGISWDQVQRVSNTTPTLQVVVNPPLRRGSPVHDRVFAELRKLQADYVRYVPWLPYPRLGVAELEPPTRDRTFWDFSLIDPMMIDFVNSTQGHPVIVNFSTIPAWLFRTQQPIKYPDADQVTWDYTQGTELRDPTGKELGAYYARLVSWYVNGGFTDELGRRHDSSHHFPIDYWEILNEVDFEHNMTPEQYTARYDAIASAIREIAPRMKFVGLALAAPSSNPRMFEYFLDPRHHRPGIPLDMISYHFYATPTEDQTPTIQPYTYFEQADRFLATVQYVEEIRKRLSPSTKTDIDEIGSILPADPKGGPVIPDSYWNLSGACYAYVFGRLAEMGIDIAGESQLVGYPTQFPSVSMVDWTTGAPNARFRVLELLKNNIGPGDSIVASHSPSPYIYALAYISKSREHKLLLVNKRDREFQVELPQSIKRIDFVDQQTKGGELGTSGPGGKSMRLGGLEVAIVTME